MIKRSGEYLRINGAWLRVPQKAEDAIREDERLKMKEDDGKPKLAA